MSASSLAFYLLSAVGFVCALIGCYYLATFAIQNAPQLEPDVILLVLGVVLIGISLWLRKR